MDEATLRKLSRAELQKLAKEHKVKSNLKSVVIIRELVKLYEAVPIIQDENSEEPPRKKSRLRGESPSTAGPSTGIIEQAKDVRDVVRAEKGRHVRLETMILRVLEGDLARMAKRTKKARRIR
ncbi:hypothetical protein DEU56DRAFT_806390 [Suillus clintonianus]|uniref:uncharacterized protein n=1 Tax=Suillus clintonianus TaxID=1904413 RepID=UPI001B87EFE8|nr:uncharacterized protein DEU56DRAFT_806390 [Suillus clintonianus]KAG2135764.1 hypothetical protein DEU56DRAFT_806390 [Suillus clintonianus]